MSLLTAQNLGFGFADGVLFQGAAFQVEPTDRVGLIGRNGVGKTTLFKLIIGQETPVTGGIVRGKDLKIGYMEQYLTYDPAKTLYEQTVTVFDDLAAIERELELLVTEMQHNPTDAVVERHLHLSEEMERRGGLYYRSLTRSALLGLGFSAPELDLPVSALSGGQRAKMSLAMLLLSDANLLLLDEPTNNLDIDAITWLEDFLSKYKGALMVVSHDRYFLDKVTNKTMEIAHRRIYSTTGNYSTFCRLKAERDLAIEREYEKTMKEIHRIEGIIEQQRRFNQEANYVTIASKQKQIDRLKEGLVVPESALRDVHFSFASPVRAGDEVLCVRGLCKAFEGKQLFRDFDLTVRRGDRVFLLGPNGCGKSTLLKIINRQLPADGGTFRFGINVRVGYFDQTTDSLHNDKTVLDEVWDEFRTMTQTEVRSALAVMLFCGEDVFKTVESLSGGERAKLSLLKILLHKPNFLILDEPTNHLDISSRTALEDALLAFDGTLLSVSHDRAFINKLSTGIVAMTKDGAVRIDGNYDDYVAIHSAEAVPAEKPKPKENEYLRRKEEQSEERRRRGRIRRIEAAIAEAEEKASALEKQLADPDVAADYEKVLALTAEMDAAHASLTALYDEWETLQS